MMKKTELEMAKALLVRLSKKYDSLFQDGKLRNYVRDGYSATNAKEEIKLIRRLLKEVYDNLG